MDYQDRQEFNTDNYKVEPTVSEVNTPIMGMTR